MEAKEEWSNCNVLEYALLIFCLVLDLTDCPWPGTDGNGSLQYTDTVFYLHLYTSSAIL